MLFILVYYFITYLISPSFFCFSIVIKVDIIEVDLHIFDNLFKYFNLIFRKLYVLRDLSHLIIFRVDQ
jgi:hypothetical protein